MFIVYLNVLRDKFKNEIYILCVMKLEKLLRTAVAIGLCVNVSCACRKVPMPYNPYTSIPKGVNYRTEGPNCYRADWYTITRIPEITEKEREKDNNR
jgi:hypothetical protein